MKPRTAFLAIVVGLLICWTGCQTKKEDKSLVFSTGTGTGTDTGTATGTDTGTDTGTGSIEPGKIGIRVIDSDGEFYDKNTGETWQMRGHNYVILGWQHKQYGDIDEFTHATFNVGDPENSAIYEYDPIKAEADLTRQEALGYNCNRVFLAVSQISDPDCTSGVNPAYVANLVDFLNRAKNHKIRTYLTFSMWMPKNYAVPLWGNEINIASKNGYYLAQSQINSRREYIVDFLTEMQNQDAPFDWIAVHSLINELKYDRNQLPLSMTGGTVTTATGTYDMSSNASKILMMQEAVTHFVNELAPAVKSVVPDALVGVGFSPVTFLENSATTWNPRQVASMEASVADFIDVHPYPNHVLGDKLDPIPQFGALLADFGFTSDKSMVRVLGEFGIRSDIYTAIDKAADIAVHWQAEAVKAGFDGSLFWRYEEEYPYDNPGVRHWDALDYEENINEALAPVNLPDPANP